MATFDLDADAWTEIVAASATKMQQIGIRFGEALIIFGAPGAVKKAIKMGGNGPRTIVVPAGTAVNARPYGPRVRVTTGDYGAGTATPTPTPTPTPVTLPNGQWGAPYTASGATDAPQGVYAFTTMGSSIVVTVDAGTAPRNYTVTGTPI